MVARELALRVASALVLAPLAIFVAYVGGWPFALFWGAAAMGVLWEWTSLVSGEDRRAVLMTGGAAVVLALALAGSIPDADQPVRATRLIAAVVVMAMGMLGAAALTSRGQRGWVAAGIPYAGAIGVAPVVLRSDASYGFIAMIILFAVVWATDILAYFIGRAVGGPKLMPKVSPKKTWSGALGGTAGAVVAAFVIAMLWGLSGLFAIAVIAALLSVASQAGDLLESFLKRRFGAKDSSHLIPGHGGLMDRLDGFVVAALFATLIGIFRGGVEAPARGLLVW
jgi:phosphatidate cytidylyltransferase